MTSFTRYFRVVLMYYFFFVQSVGPRSLEKVLTVLAVSLEACCMVEQWIRKIKSNCGAIRGLNGLLFTTRIFYAGSKHNVLNSVSQFSKNAVAAIG